MYVHWKLVYMASVVTFSQEESGVSVDLKGLAANAHVSSGRLTPLCNFTVSAHVFLTNELKSLCAVCIVYNVTACFED